MGTPKRKAYTLTPRRLSYLKAVESVAGVGSFVGLVDFALITTIEHYNLIVKDPGYTIMIGAYNNFHPFDLLMIDEYVSVDSEVFDMESREYGEYDMDCIVRILREVYPSSTVTVEREDCNYRPYVGFVRNEGSPMFGKQYSLSVCGLKVAVLREDGVHAISEEQRVAGIIRNIILAVKGDE